MTVTAGNAQHRGGTDGSRAGRDGEARLERSYVPSSQLRYARRHGAGEDGALEAVLDEGLDDH